MFDIGPMEVLVIVAAAVILFGPEKLPELARKAARIIQYLRGIAGNAQSQLTKELGPEFANVEITDLNPKAFVRKHLLSDVDPIIADVKKDFEDGTAAGRDLAADATAAGRSASSNGMDGGQVANEVGGLRLAPFDVEAT